MVGYDKHFTTCIGLAAVILTGCATQSDVLSSRILGSSRGSSLQHTTYQYAAGNRDLKTTIIGNPFNLPNPDFENQVTQLMRGNDLGVNANFTTSPGNSMRNGYHLVMLFNPSANVSLDRLCSDPGNEKSTVSDNKLSVLLVFCGPEPITAATASVKSVSSYSDPKFGSLIRNVTFNMTPPVPQVSSD